MEEEKRKYECALKRQEGGSLMNFANLVGMYKVALNRCIDVIACNEENSSVEEIIDAVDCTLTMIDGNEDLLALLTLDDTYRLILYKYHRILCLIKWRVKTKILIEGFRHILKT